MILLLDGCNCTGKSTLAKAFSEALEIPILKFGLPPDAAYPYFRDALIAQYRQAPHFIIDRCHLSNYAYNGRLGGGVLTPDQWWKVDLFLSQMDAWLFLMVDDPQSIASRLQERQGRDDGANARTRHEIGDLQNRFLESFDASQIQMKASFGFRQFIDGNEMKTSHFLAVVDKMKEAITKSRPRVIKG